MRTGPDHHEAPPAEPAPWWETAPVVSLAPPDAPPEEPPVVPVPGRHASRRRRAASWRPLVPETLRGRVLLGPWQLTVTALLVAGGLAVTCWWVVRSDAGAVAPVAPVASGAAAPLVPVVSPTDSAPAAIPPSGARAGTVTVDVSGDVRRPGVLELPAGSRVVDALAAAGGPRRGVDLGSLNRARVLVDGEQIVVGAPGGPGAPGAAAPPGATAGGGSSGPASPAALVNLNTASLAELEALPEVGPVTAQAILDYRAEHGGFGSVDELLDVSGIGEKTLAQITPHVTV